MRILEYTVLREGTLERFLRNEKGFSLSSIRRLKKYPGSVLVNGKAAIMPSRVFPGDKVKLTLSEPALHVKPNFTLSAGIVYEDEDIIVFDKPAGMPVHPSPSHKTDTLANFFAARFAKEENPPVFRPINRLDANTSGLCAAAKNAYCAYALSKTLKKEYLAICCGIPEKEQGTICAPIARVEGSIIAREVNPSGSFAVTHYSVLNKSEDAALVKITLDTGRTHQIRVHFAYIGHPLAGDDLYGGDLSKINRHALHCYGMSFEHPVTGKKIYLESPLPEDMKKCL